MAGNKIYGKIMEQRSTPARLGSAMGDNKNRMLSRDISESLGKLSPQATDVEETVLGAILSEKNAIVEVASILRPEHFYSDQHKEIYTAIQQMFAAGIPIDMRTVVIELRKNGKLEVVGGAYYIAELTSKAVSAANIEHHSRILLEMAMKRSLIQVASQMHHDAYEDTMDVFSLLEKTNLEVQAIFDGAIGTRSEKELKETCFAVMKEVQSRQTGVHTGLDSGYPELDKMLNGFNKTDLIIIAARPGMGKAQSLDEKLLTINGWIKMRDVKMGDLLVGSDGEFYPVTGIYPQGIKKTSKVIFDDGSEVICDDDHLWYTQTRADRKIKGARKGTVKKTTDIKNSLYKGVRKNHSIPFVKPVQFPHIKIMIDPYLYGVLIGDGGLTNGTPVISNPEQDVVEKCKSLMPEGYMIKSRTAITHSVRSCDKKSSFYEFIPELKNKYSYEKSIKQEYLINSVENRIRLLQGLMDTDGNVTDFGSPWIMYSTTSEILSDQIIDLVRGLGGRASVTKKHAHYRKDGERFEARDYFRIIIAFTNGIVPVTSKKHLEKYKPKNYSQKFIKDIVDNGLLETQCISVSSPDHLYVTTGTTLTHNTAYAIQAGKNVAAQGHPVGVFSLEMSANQLVERLACSECEIESDKTKKGILTPYEWERFSAGLGAIAKLPLYIDDSPFMTIVELRARAMRMKTKYGIKLIVVDYLQLIKGINELGRNSTRDQELGMITRTLKGIAKELDVPVIALSQLSRAVEQRGGVKRPQLSDLRESGAIEQDADVVMFLYRPEYYKITEDSDGYSTQGLCEVIVEKHRNGALGTVKQKFVGKFTKFMDWITDYSPATTTERQEKGVTRMKDPTEQLKDQDQLKDEDQPF